MQCIDLCQSLLYNCIYKYLLMQDVIIHHYTYVYMTQLPQLQAHRTIGPLRHISL